MPKNSNRNIGKYTANLVRADNARRSEEHKRKPRRQRFLDGHLLDVASKEEKYPNLANIKYAVNPPLSQPQKIARAKRKKEERRAAAHAHTTPIALPLAVVLLLFVPGVEAVAATSVLQLLTMVTATSASVRNRALSSDSTPEYSVDTLTANCATGAKWTLTQPNSGTEHMVAGVTTLSTYKLNGEKQKCPRIYVSEVSRSTNSSKLLGINAQNGTTAFSYTRQPEDEYHDGGLAATSIVTASGNTITVGTAQQNSGFLDSKVCENITEKPPAKSDSYASTYGLNFFDEIYPIYFHRPLTYMADFTILAPQSIPQKGEIDVTPHKTSLSVYLAATGIIKTTSTATQKDLCTIYTMGDGAAPIHTQLAVYQEDDMEPNLILRMPEDARALFVNAGEVNDYLSIRNPQGTQDLVLAGRDLAGEERVLVIQDFDQIEGEANCTELVAQPTGWQEIRIQGQRKGVFNFFDRRTALLAATPAGEKSSAGKSPNLFLSTIDNPTAPLWKINLDLFSGQIILGENHTITMPIQVPVFYNTTDAITVHQTISLSQLSASGEQILVVGQTYVYDGGTPLDAPVLDTLTAFNATTGNQLFVITGGIDTWGMGMNHQMTATDALLVAQMNGQAGMITLNLLNLQTGTTQTYFIPGTQQNYTVQCRMPPSPSPSPVLTPTPTPTPVVDDGSVSTLTWVFLGLAAALVGGGIGMVYSVVRARRAAEEQAPLLPQPLNGSPRPANQLASNSNFFPSAASGSLPKMSKSERYAQAYHQLQQLKKDLEPYASDSNISRILGRIEQLLSDKISDKSKIGDQWLEKLEKLENDVAELQRQSLAILSPSEPNIQSFSMGMRRS